MNKTSVLLLKILILLVPFYFFRFAIGPIPTTLLEVGIYLIFGYFLLSGSLNLKNQSRLIWPAALLVVFAMTGAVIDPDLARGLGLWKAYFFDGFLVYLMFISVEEKDKESLGKFAVYSGAITAAICLLMYFFGSGSADGRLLDIERLSPNYLAMFLTPLLVLTLFFIQKNRSVLSYICAILIFTALALTGSRGALVGIVGTAVVAIYYYLKTKKIRWSGWALTAMLVVFLAGGYFIFKPDWTDHGRKATSSNIRYYIWTTSLEIAGEKPLKGVGLGNFQDYFSQKTNTWVNYPEFISPVALTAHNLYLEIWLTTGLAGLVAFVYLLVSTRFYRGENQMFGLAVCSILFYGLVDTPLYRNDLTIIFWLLLALAAIKVKKHA